MSRFNLRPVRASLRQPELLALLALAGVLNLWALSRNGWANEYYSAAVRSMSGSWHNFLFASFDPQGVMTVDKPPLALWVQTLSVKLFGFHSLSLLVPQALMGVASVALVHDLTRRRWGRAAGFLAGLALAITPISVAISRHNNPDALLVLCCTAALWCMVRALEDDRMRWLVLSGVFVGLGFETKMAAALLVLPGLVAAWLWVAPRGRLKALRQLLAGGAALLVVGGVWPLLVALTPAADRPWVSGTNDNSIFSLIAGYNGLGRLDGQAGGPQALGGGGGRRFGGGAGVGGFRIFGANAPAGPGAFGGGRPGGGGGAGGSVFGEGTGPFRLLNASLGGQAGWLLGFALVGGLAILAASRLRRRDPRTGWLIAVGGAFLTTAVAFSTAKGIFHPYYVSLLAPFLAALVGAGAAQLTRRGIQGRLFGALAVIAGVAGELVVLHNNAGTLTWLKPLLVGGGVAAAILCLGGARLRTATLAGMLALLLIAPATWAVQTLGHATSGTFPAGGPASAGIGGGGPGFGGGGGGFGRGRAPLTLFGNVRARNGRAPITGGGPFGGNDQELTEALSYTARHGGGTIALSSQSGAAAQIIAAGSNVAGIGGFSGRESDVTISWFAQEVRSGHIRWVLTGGSTAGPGGAAGSDGRTGATTVLAKVAKSCRAVSDFQSSETNVGAGEESSETGLYDCAGRAGELAAVSR